MISSTPTALFTPLSSEPWAGDDYFGPVPELRQRPSHPTKSSYAHITGRTTDATNTATKPLPLHPTEIDRQHRTYVLRRLQPATTTSDVIRQVTGQLRVPENELFEAVLRDPQDRRRFYLTYATTELKRYATGHGFTIGNIHIKPQDDSLDGYIPFPPYYIDITTLDTLLRQHGELVSSSFVQTAHQTRVAGYRFKLKLKQGLLRPTSVTYNTCVMDIKFQDDVKLCTYCRKPGHLAAGCRSRLAVQADRQSRQDAEREEKRLQWDHELQTIQEESEEALREAHYQLQTRLQTSADVFQEDLAHLTQDGASPTSLLQWEQAYNDHTAVLQTSHEEVVAQIVDDNLTSKTMATDSYRKAGGRPPASSIDAMEVDAISPHTLVSSSTRDPDGEAIAEARASMNVLVYQIKLAALPGEDDPSSAVEPVPVTSEVPTADSVSVTTTSPLLVTTVTTSTTASSVQRTPPHSPAPPVLPPVIPYKSSNDECQQHYAALAATLPPVFNANTCPYLVSFHTYAKCTGANVRAVFCGTLFNYAYTNYPTVNVAGMLLQQSQSDSSLYLVYCLDDRVLDLSMRVLQSLAPKFLAITNISSEDNQWYVAPT